MGKLKQLKKLKEQQDRLNQFDQEFDHYEEKDMGGEMWVKMWNGGTKRWQVAIFSPKSFRRYKGFNNNDYEQHQRNFEDAINKEE